MLLVEEQDRQFRRVTLGGGGQQGLEGVQRAENRNLADVGAGPAVGRRDDPDRTEGRPRPAVQFAQEGFGLVGLAHQQKRRAGQDDPGAWPGGQEGPQQRLFVHGPNDQPHPREAADVQAPGEDEGGAGISLGAVEDEREREKQPGRHGRRAHQAQHVGDRRKSPGGPVGSLQEADERRGRAIGDRCAEQGRRITDVPGGPVTDRQTIAQDQGDPRDGGIDSQPEQAHRYPILTTSIMYQPGVIKIKKRPHLQVV